MNKFSIFLYDMKRALHEPAFIISVIIGVIILAFSNLIFIFNYINNENVIDTDTLFKNSQALIFPFAAPLLCALPYGGMRMFESETGFKALMILKMRRIDYILPRFFTCGFTGSISLLIPSLLLLTASAFLGNGYQDFYECLKGTLLCIPFGFAYAVLSYSLTFYNRKRYIPVVFPQVLYLLCIYAFPHLNISRFYPPLGISPWIYGDTSYLDLLLMSGIIISASAIITFTAYVIRSSANAFRRELV